MLILLTTDSIGVYTADTLIEREAMKNMAQMSFTLPESPPTSASFIARYTPQMMELMPVMRSLVARET